MASEHNYPSRERIEHLERVLLTQMRQQLPQLRELLKEITGHSISGGHHQEHIYRFYYGSLKVFRCQEATQQIVAALKQIAPEGQTFCKEFQRIIADGTGRTFTLDDNNHWSERTRPMVEAYLHARHMLEMAIEYGEKLEAPAQWLPYGWATLLCLYGIR